VAAEGDGKPLSAQVPDCSGGETFTVPLAVGKFYSQICKTVD
jgi:hypothetical protein